MSTPIGDPSSIYSNAHKSNYLLGQHKSNRDSLYTLSPNTNEERDKKGLNYYMKEKMKDPKFPINYNPITQPYQQMKKNFDLEHGIQAGGKTRRTRKHKTHRNKRHNKRNTKRHNKRNTKRHHKRSNKSRKH